ncbi:radical SAM family heme chaperone HemW [Thermodesulfobacterium commune]|uniref:radical SAM family heme chaperone HemW n=1 Tax=Thermodesulfobacterium commune TaxID=1741 RepID=UPI002FDB38FA
MAFIRVALYLHVPFCIKKCPYCDFYSLPHVPSPDEEKTYLKAVKTEVLYLKDFVEKLSGTALNITTFYAGGGTPSLLSPGFYQELFEFLSSQFRFTPVELTLEANPDTITPEKLKGFVETGFNRLSLGVQSLSEKGLKTLKRTYQLKTALKALDIASSLFSNLSVDFIFGWKGQGLKTLKEEIKKALSFSPTHLSFYELTLEHEVSFSGFSPNKPVDLFYRFIEHTLESQGYVRYEISNYARPGFECRHNLFYWEVKPYVGLGPSAVSRIANLRWQNPQDLKAYVETLLNQKKLPLTPLETLTPLDFAKEYVFMGLRLKKGIDLRTLSAKFGYYLDPWVLKNLIEKGLIERKGNRVSLTSQGRLFHNQVVKLLWKTMEKA